MSDVATKEDLATLQSEMRSSFDELTGMIGQLMQDVDERFNKVEQEIIELRKSHNRLLNTIDGFIARIDKYETELAARDNQFEKLLVWAKKVSDKTGIPLEGL